MKVARMRFPGLLLAIFLVAGGLVWSSGKSEGASGAAASAPAARPTVTLRVSWWGGQSRAEATLKAMDLYASMNKNVTLQGEYGGFDGYFEKLITQLSAGTAPDVMQTDVQWLDQFFKQISLFVDLYTAPHMDLGGFDKGFLKGITSPDGKLIGLPTGITSTAFYMNKTLADKLGIDYSQQMTWARLLTEGKALHQKDSNVYMLNMTVNQDIRSMLWEPYLFTITGKRLMESDGTLGFDRDALVKAYTYINNLYDNGVMQPVAETANIQTGQLYQNPKWLNNQIVFYLDLTSRYAPVTSSIKGSQIIVVDFPSPKDVKNSGILLRPTNLFTINARAKSVDEASRFTSWLLSDPEAAKILKLERAIPASAPARDALVAAGVVDKYFDFATRYGIAHAGLSQSFLSLNTEIQKIEDDTLAKVAYKEWTPEKAADEMIRQMTDKTAELKSR
jgi:oligogalacturonide transport system substrate-binding protein